jgi:hypothetical protein
MLKFIEKIIRSRMHYTNGYWVYKFNNGGELCVGGLKNQSPITILKREGYFEDVVADVKNY